MLDWTQCAAVERVPGKVSGAWVFKTTRVPVRALFENLEDGATVNDFLTQFPGVTREQAEAVLEHAKRSLARSLPAEKEAIPKGLYPSAQGCEPQATLGGRWVRASTLPFVPYGICHLRHNQPIRIT
jgi:uncharacterized protein (DUF433 family)